MRTKTLLITAALSLAGVATSMAQVYSVNAVGYINVTLKPSFNLIANQLNQTGAGGNSLNNVFPGAAAGTQILKFSNALNNYSGPWYSDGTAWFDGDGNPSPATANAGEGIIMFNESSLDVVVTMVGEVPQGTLSVPLPSGFSMVANPVPQQSALTAASSFPPIDGAQYLTFNTAGQKLNDPLYSSGGAWFTDVGDPVVVAPAVGQGWFYFNPEAATTWTRVFSVN